METFAPEAAPNTKPFSKELLMMIQSSMVELRKIDWADAEKGIYPKSV